MKSGSRLKHRENKNYERIQNKQIIHEKNQDNQKRENFGQEIRS